MKAKTRKIITAVIILLALLTVFSLVMICVELKNRQRDIEVFDELYKLVSESVDESEADSSEEITESTDENQAPAVNRPVINLPLLIEQNEDCIGWLWVEGTLVNYPVMHTPNERHKYLHKSFYGDSSRSGVPFLDEACTLDSDNLIIHGHNMLNGTMFATLKYYLDKSFCTAHPTIELQTPDETVTYEIYAVLLNKADDVWYSFTSEDIEADFNFLIGHTKDLALYTTDITPEAGDRFITLSTCYGKNDDDRLTVIGVAK